MARVILILLLFLVQANSTFAYVFDKNFRLQKDTNLMKVAVYDDATGGCWTNILESKKYAEDKLKLLGVNITDDPDLTIFAPLKNYTFSIHVLAQRFSGYCSGKISISVETLSIINEKLHLAKIYTDSHVSISLNNLNNDILHVIGKAFKELK